MKLSVSEKKGFTLVEIILAIGILSLLMVLLIPNFRKSRANTTLRADAYAIKGDLEYTRMLAKSKGVNSTFKFAQPSNKSESYEILDGTSTSVKSSKLSGGIAANYSSLTGSGDLQFKPNGSCTLDGNITISSINTNKYFEIKLNSSSGLISITEKN